MFERNITLHTKFIGAVCSLVYSALVLSGCGGLELPTPTVVLPTPSNSAEPQGDQLFLSDFDVGLVERVDLSEASFLETSVIVIGSKKLEDGACNAKGQIFFAEPTAQSIIRFDADGNNQTTVLDPSARTSEGQEFYPEGLSFDSSGNLFFNTSGTPFVPHPHTGVYRIAGGDPASKPERVIPPFTTHGEGTAFLSTGELLAVGWTDGRIVKSNPPQFGLGEVFASDIPLAHGIAVDSHDNVFVSEGGEVGNETTSRIFRLDAKGNSLDVFVTLEGVARHMEFDSKNNLYVGSITGGVFRITPNGTIHRIAQARHVSGLAICKGGQGH